MGSRVIQVFQQYQLSRGQFAQQVADLSQRAECVEQLIQGNAVILLKNLLTDISPSIQQNAVLALGRLANYDPKIAEMLVRQEIVKNLLYFTMDKNNRYLKRTSLGALRSVVKHSSELSKNVIDMGGLDQVVSSLEEFDPGVKEAAAWVLGYMARHDFSLANSVIRSGAVPLLVLCLQEPEVSVRQVAASALNDIAKHSPETAQAVIDAGAIPHLVRAITNVDPRLKRQSLGALCSVAKHTVSMAEIIVEAQIFPLVLETAGHPDELVRKAACALIRDIVKHTPELSQLVVEAGGLGVLVNAILRNHGEAKLPAIMALGFIAGHNSSLALSVIYSKGVDALAVTIEDESDTHVGASAAWALGHIGRHSPEHSKNISKVGLLPRMLQIYSNPLSNEDARMKAKQSLKMILVRTDDLESIEPLLTEAPPAILKYVVAQFSKILPRDPKARRAFVTSGGLRKLQELLTSEAPEGSVLREHILIINACFPDDIVKYFSPNYPETLLDRVEEYKPPLSVDPTLWTERLFSDTQIPTEIRDEILDDLQRNTQMNTQVGSSSEKGMEKEEQEEAESVASRRRGTGDGQSSAKSDKKISSTSIEKTTSSSKTDNTKKMKQDFAKKMQPFMQPSSTSNTSNSNTTLSNSSLTNLPSSSKVDLSKQQASKEFSQKSLTQLSTNSDSSLAQNQKSSTEKLSSNPK